MCFFQKKEKKISFEKSFLRYLFLLKKIYLEIIKKIIVIQFIHNCEEEK